MSRNILTNTIYKIVENLNEQPGFWQGVIRFESDDFDSHFAISDVAFGRAIKPIVETYLKSYSEDDTVAILVDKINKIWDIVIAKWPKCFIYKDYYNYETKSYDIVKTKYNPNFCLCTVYGVMPIMTVYNEVCTYADDIAIFKDIIVNCAILDKQWDKYNGPFCSCSVNYKDIRINDIAEYIKGNKKLD